MIRALVVACVLAALPALAEEAPPAVRAPKVDNGNAVALEATVTPAYLRMFQRDWLGAQTSVGFGGQNRHGFAALARVTVLAGQSTLGLTFQHYTLAAVFVIPTGTRLRIAVAQELGYLVVQVPHTGDGQDTTMTIGGFIEPTVDLWRRRTLRVYAVGRGAIDFVGDLALTASLGLGVMF